MQTCPRITNLTLSTSNSVGNASHDSSVDLSHFNVDENSGEEIYEVIRNYSIYKKHCKRKPHTYNPNRKKNKNTNDQFHTIVIKSRGTKNIITKK